MTPIEVAGLILATAALARGNYPSLAYGGNGNGFEHNKFNNWWRLIEEGVKDPSGKTIVVEKSVEDRPQKLSGTAKRKLKKARVDWAPDKKCSLNSDGAKRQTSEVGRASTSLPRAEKRHLSNSTQ